MRSSVICILTGLLAIPAQAAAPPVAPDTDLSRKAIAVLKTHCYTCHGLDGAVEGGFNYVIDRDRLVSRRKVVPGDATKSSLFTKIVSGKMPPPDVKMRLNHDEIDILRQWINAGAPGATTPPRRLISEAEVLDWILADIDKTDRRARRFVRYFSLVAMYNSGLADDELRTQRNALTKLINSLSWHPRISIPRAIDPTGLVLRIDLRDYQLDAASWNRVLADYPYGVLQDSGVSRAVLVATATRMPVVRADWFIATASRAPMYYDLLQMPANLADLERQLRVDAGVNIQQERVARAGFNGSGISRNNRILERHDAMNGAYWRTYDFEAVPQNLLDRSILAPDRRNIFAYPLGPGLGENGFQHAGGEAIFNLPNGLQAYILVNANNTRINKGPTEIVSDPKRPDRAVEAGLSCINCHARGIIQKDDMLREHVGKNRKAFSRADVELVEALYPQAKKMRELMDEDAKRFQAAVEKTGNKTNAAEVVMAMTLRYEGDVDLAMLAAELGVEPSQLSPKLTATETLTRNMGALKVEGAVVSRQVVVQSFADLVRELKLGTAIEPGRIGESLPNQTGEADPLEAQSFPANAAAISPDGKLAAFASADRSVRIHDIEVSRDLRRCIGHTASVWCVAFSPDGTRLVSGGKDGSVRVWDVGTGRELVKIDAHLDFVSAVAFSSDGKRILSAGYDHEVSLWDAARGTRVNDFAFTGARYINALAFCPDGKHILVAGEKKVHLVDLSTRKTVRQLEGHGGWVTAMTVSAYGERILTASDDGTAMLWETKTAKCTQVYRGHAGYAKAVAFDGVRVLTGGSDATVRLYDRNGKEEKVFRKHADSLVSIAFAPGGKQTLSVSRDAVVLPWTIGANKAPVLPKDTRFTPEVPATETALQPKATIRVGGTIGTVLLSSDRKFMYYLDLTNHCVGQVDTKTLKNDKSVTLHPTTRVMALSPDGKRLVAPWAITSNHGKYDSPPFGLQWVQLDSMKVASSTSLSFPAYDVALSDEEVFLSQDRSDWTRLWRISPNDKNKDRDLGDAWGRSFVALSPDGKRLFSSSQSVVPGTLDVFDVAGKASSKRPAQHEKLALGGEFVVSPDGKYLVCKTGTVLTLSSDRDKDLTLHTRIEAHLSIAIDAQSKSAWLVTREGTLRRYSYPEFSAQDRWRPALTAYAVAFDAKTKRLYIAGFDPRSVIDRPRAKGHGDIHVYAIPE